MGPPRFGTYIGLLYILLILDSVTSDMQEFFANLPSDIGNSVHIAWNNIIEAIKRPVRIRRLGRTGRTKTTRVYSTSTKFTPLRPILRKTPIDHNHVIPLTTIRSLKLVLPVLVTPQWKSLFDWRRRHQNVALADTIVNNYKKSSEPYNYASYDRTAGVSEVLSVEEEARHFGNLFFV